MSDYLFIYRTADAPPQLSEERRAQWGQFFGGFGEHLTEMGAPVLNSTTVGSESATTVSGYSKVQASSLEEAVKLTDGAPVLGQGGSVEVAELTPVPAHI